MVNEESSCLCRREIVVDYEMLFGGEIRMNSGVTKIGFARSAFFSFTQKEIGRTSLLKSFF